jgi:acyl carrier protein
MSIDEQTVVSRERLLSVLRSAVAAVVDEDLPEFGESMRLGEELDVDSLDLVEITMLVEEELGIETDSDDFKGLETVGDLVDVLATLTR